MFIIGLYQRILHRDECPMAPFEMVVGHRIVPVYRCNAEFQTLPCIYCRMTATMDVMRRIERPVGIFPRICAILPEHTWIALVENMCLHESEHCIDFRYIRLVELLPVVCVCSNELGRKIGMDLNGKMIRQDVHRHDKRLQCDRNAEGVSQKGTVKVAVPVAV